MVSLLSNASFGVYVKTKKSLDPYLLFTSLRYFRSASFSNSKESEEASKLKFLKKKEKAISISKSKTNKNFAFLITTFLYKLVRVT